MDPDPKDPYNVAWSGSDIFSRDPDPDLKLDHLVNVKTKDKFAKLNLKNYLWNLSIYFSSLFVSTTALLNCFLTCSIFWSSYVFYLFNEDLYWVCVI